MFCICPVCVHQSAAIMVTCSIVDANVLCCKECAACKNSSAVQNLEGMDTSVNNALACWFGGFHVQASSEAAQLACMQTACSLMSSWHI